MKQEDIEKALISYKDSMGSCSRAPVRSPWGRRFALGVTAIAVVGLGMVTMWPRDAKAGTLRRMTVAIGNAKTMEVIATLERPAGHWFTLWHSYYKDGMWRIDVDKSTGMKLTQIIRDGQTLTQWKGLDHATVEPTTEADLQTAAGETNAVEYAKSLLDTGQTSIDRTVTIRDHEPVNGRATYVIAMDRPANEYHSELIVDKSTNLPLLGTVSVHQTSALGAETVQMRQEYRYDAPVSSDLFSFNVGKPVIKPAEAKAALLGEVHPQGKVKETEVLDAAVSPSGTVWIMVATTNDKVLPTTLADDAGNVYARGRDVGSTEKGDQLQDGNRNLILVPFTNMNPNKPLPTRVSLGFAQREGWYPYHAAPEDQHVTPIGKQLNLKVRIEPDLRPSYFTAFDLDRYGFELEMLDWHNRAQKYEADKQYIKAAHAYEKCAKAYGTFIKRGAFFPTKEAARCYALAGDALSAKRAEAIAEELRIKKER